jgi:hypothetical protein
VSSGGAMSSKRYAEEFKIEAVKQITERCQQRFKIDTVFHQAAI